MSIAQFEIDWESVASGGVPHEEAFGYLSQVALDEPAVVIDVGANSGISALSVHFVQPTWPIISYEPNGELEPLLRRTQEFIRSRGGEMDYRLAGLADVNDDSMTFRIPIVDTTYQEVLSMGSFAVDEFEKEFIQSYLGQRFMQSGTWTGELKELRFPVRRFDDEPCPPSTFYLVKIDVEGFELQVLEGMMGFIKDAKPALLVEMGGFDSFVEMDQRLAGFGYRAYWYDHLSEQLLPSPLPSDLHSLSISEALGPLGRRGYETRLASITASEAYNVYFIADGSPFLPHGVAGTGVSQSAGMTAKRLRRAADAKANQSIEWRELNDERRGLYERQQTLYAEREMLYAEREALHAEREALRAHLQQSYDERQTLYDQREALYEQRQDLYRRVGDLDAAMEAQSALVTAQELTLQGYVYDHVRLGQLEVAQRQIEHTLTWRIHQKAARFRLVQVVARWTRWTARKIRH